MLNISKISQIYICKKNQVFCLKINFLFKFVLFFKKIK
jgi:hypothetical protein